MLQRLRARARWVAALGALVLTGCYTYVPVQIGAAPRGATVRAALRGDPEFDVGDYKVRDAARVDGQVISWEGDTLALSALELRTDGGESFPGGGYTVKLPLSQVTGLSLKQLSKTRTVLVVVGAAAAALLGQQSLTGAFRSQGSAGSGGSKK